jgi:ABC-type dipeptide/oligopeptide/nickel transport system permease component
MGWCYLLNGLLSPAVIVQYLLRAIVVLLAFAVILCNLLADLLARRIDPRLGSGAGGAA